MKVFGAECSVMYHSYMLIFHISEPEKGSIAFWMGSKSGKVFFLAELSKCRVINQFFNRQCYWKRICSWRLPCPWRLQMDSKQVDICIQPMETISLWFEGKHIHFWISRNYILNVVTIRWMLQTMLIVLNKSKSYTNCL